MTTIEIARVASLYVPLCLVAVLWMAAPPPPRVRAAALLATAWTLPTLIGVHVAAARLGWWTFAATRATIAGFPVDLWVGWALLWGAIPALLPRRMPVAAVVAAALLIDVIAMPQLQPVVQLGPRWFMGDIVAIAICLVPAQLLARWTADDRFVRRRATLQMLIFGGLTFGILPHAILENTGASWAPLLDRPGWINGLLVQLVAFAALLGVSALQEFATRGRGTPVPFDPPTRLVLSGPYAYVRNPMQLSAALAMAGWGAMLESWLVAAAGVVAVIYGAGFAAGDEGSDLSRRFGDDWTRYTRGMRAWVPRWRPIDASLVSPDTRRATLYVAEECGPCSEVRRWFDAREPIALDIVAAERHPTRTLRRVTYDPGDGSGDAEGIIALGRALEHVHFGWAMIGMVARLPGVAQSLQLIADASGGAPRTTIRYCDRALVPDDAQLSPSESAEALARTSAGFTL